MFSQVMWLVHQTVSTIKQLFVTQKYLSLSILALLLGCAVGIGYFAQRLRQEVDYLAIANSDSIQWSLAQFEVELLELETALLMADANSDLEPIRMKFDIFYSRYETVHSSSQYAQLRLRPGVVESLSQIRGYLDRTVSYIDSYDGDLRESLPQLVGETDQIRPLVRGISLIGVETFARAADERRQGVVSSLSQTASLVIGLIVTLVTLVMVLLLLVRIAWVTSKDYALVANRLASIVATSLDAILVVDREGFILNFNGAAERIFGYSQAEAIGQSMAELVVPKQLRDRHHVGMRRYLDTGQKRVIDAGRVPIEAMRKGGEVFPAELSVSTAMSKTGEIFVSYIRDVSEIVAAQTELVEARDKAIAGERTKAEFIAVMSHEMRTPLNGLLGALDLLSDTEIGIGKERDLIDVMKKSGELLLNHVNDVLDISQLDARMTETYLQNFDAIKLVEGIANSQISHAETNGNELFVEVNDNSLSYVVGDPKRLKHILLNLLGNAIKFTRNGQVRLRARRLPNGMVEFSVSDTGIGIPEKDISRIFDDFVTLDASYSRTASGTGLGLGIARRLTKAMSGTIGVESVVGSGTRFWVQIPLSPSLDHQNADAEGDHHVRTAQVREQQPACDEVLDVLLVEDNAINRVVIRSMLEKYGHCVKEARDGREGIEMANKYPFDVILMDISMPIMDGVLAAQEIHCGRGASSDVPIIAVTAHAMPSDLERFAQAQMNEVLIKPVSQKTLIETITKVTRTVPIQTIEDNKAQIAAGMLIDFAALCAMRADLGEEMRERLIVQFLEDTDSRMKKLPSETLTAENRAAAIAQIHALAGTAALFGANKLFSRLVELESELKLDCCIEWPKSHNELITILQQTREALIKAKQ